jgi:hypothetical protein
LGAAQADNFQGRKICHRKKDMEKQEFPFRLVYFVITIIVIFACLIGLYLQNPDGFWNWLTVAGVFLSVVLLVFTIGAIYGTVNEIKNKKFQEQSGERLKQHQARFYCHICGKPSPQPYQYWDQNGEDGHLYSEFLVTDVDKPTELVQCARCQKWTCPDADPPHLENGVCKKCLENTPEQV